MTQLVDPADTGKEDSEELIVARVIAEFAPWAIGRDLGEPTEHDDGSRPALVDVLFLDADPPAALEVTKIIDPQFVETAAVANPHAEDLTALAEELSVGRWFINILPEARLRQIHGAVESLMRDHSRHREVLMSKDGLRSGLPTGVISVRLQPDWPSAAVISTWSAPGAMSLREFGPELYEAIVNNQVKLGKMGGYETHLAVDMHALRASDPARTHPPTLPPEIKHLWVVRRHFSAFRGRPVVWHLARGDTEWKVDGAPHDAV